jgi:hypothetical protein
MRNSVEFTNIATYSVLNVICMSTFTNMAIMTISDVITDKFNSIEIYSDGYYPQKLMYLLNDLFRLGFPNKILYAFFI